MVTSISKVEVWDPQLTKDMSLVAAINHIFSHVFARNCFEPASFERDLRRLSSIGFFARIDSTLHLLGHNFEQMLVKA